MRECGVCFDAFTTIQRKEIKCPYCDKGTCLSCFKTYLLDQASEPTCMHCKKGLTPDFLDSTFSKSFRRGELRKQKATILCELEKSLLPATMQYLELRKKQSRYAIVMTRLRTECDTMVGSLEISEALTELVQEAKELRADLGLKKKDRVDRTVKCPGTDCRGYITISRTGTCALCSYTLCRTCGTERKDLHDCTPDDIATYSLLKDAYKQCPKCGTHIERVSGCSQMFCVSCHSAFDWNTLKVLTGPVHNPHYFEFLRTRGIQGLVANDCNENLFGLHDILPPAFHTVVYWHPCASNPHSSECTRVDCLRKLHFFEMWQVANWILAESTAPADTYTNTSYEHLRIRFLQNRLSEREWITQLSAAETRRCKRNRLHEINVMFATVARDLALRLADTRNYIEFAGAMNELRVYTLTEKRRILEDYSDRSIRHPNDEWQYTLLAK